jgi:cyclin C
MNNPTGARTRSSSSQLTSLVNATDINRELGLPPPPSGAAEFIASFEISLPVLLSCVQDIVVLYPIWEAFEPSTRPNAGANTPTSGLGALAALKGDKTETKKEKFGPEEAEALIKRMIEERAVDLNHPDNAGQEEAKKAPSIGSTSSNGSLAGKKRTRN